MNTQKALEIAQIIGTLLTAIGLFYTAIQLRYSTRATQGQFLLTLDDLADRYNELYYELRKAFDDQSPLPNDHFSDATLLKIKEYMGFLEHSEVLIQQGSIDSRTFDDLFGHRVRALAFNPQIMTATIHTAPDRWRQFSKLIRRLRVIPAQRLTNADAANA